FSRSASSARASAASTSRGEDTSSVLHERNSAWAPGPSSGGGLAEASAALLPRRPRPSRPAAPPLFLTFVAPLPHAALRRLGRQHDDTSQHRVDDRAELEQPLGPTTA